MSPTRCIFQPSFAKGFWNFLRISLGVSAVIRSETILSGDVRFRKRPISLLGTNFAARQLRFPILPITYKNFCPIVRGGGGPVIGMPPLTYVATQRLANA